MKIKVILAAAAAFLVIIIGVGWGSVYIPPADIFSVIGNKLFGTALPEHIKSSTAAILWSSRLCRVLLAFAAGAALSASGTVMQSVMRNPLASSFTLGVSSGSSLGASIVIFYGASLPVASGASLPVMGFVFGLGSIFLALAVAGSLDGQISNNTVILVGMVLSLFINAVTTLMSAISRENTQELLYWQLGSFQSRGWTPVYILVPVAVIGVLFITHYNRELDIMTFGENQAMSMGVNLKVIKRVLLVAAAALTGASISFCGIVGFVDLVAPHIVRKIFGASHRYVVPMSAIFGGAFMVICDLAARTLPPVGELPVGAVTAIIGAPFFAFIYFGGKKKHADA
ncbi:MAG: iron ABC transporter permease [Clostridiales bacterium]|jgi:iron complex transport system permease protein|nr:iron ABC transporter permease [Clostridiales bacterium]